jgi:hypothetical protein
MPTCAATHVYAGFHRQVSCWRLTREGKDILTAIQVWWLVCLAGGCLGIDTHSVAEVTYDAGAGEIMVALGRSCPEMPTASVTFADLKREIDIGRSVHMLLTAA